MAWAGLAFSCFLSFFSAIARSYSTQFFLASWSPPKIAAISSGFFLNSSESGIVLAIFFRIKQVEPLRFDPVVLIFGGGRPRPTGALGALPLPLPVDGGGIGAPLPLPAGAGVTEGTPRPYGAGGPPLPLPALPEGAAGGALPVPLPALPEGAVNAVGGALPEPMPSLVGLLFYLER